ncbi:MULTISPECIES: L-glutamate gamma-semialdehyde dehydrogenase [Methylosinus]|uniref:Bifunctional protein PutA n=1 Tax=Methylosinus trichosporium (strain ATCC 35070 / NCIMB 11131 / UNIQEM 75 / OB3b) TaxID=595536 RepID=A0A2D2D5Z1_METT3|nr:MULTISPECIES: L-glutamate gamma-semialdehyde dehydrogenase [Methylosinus]ATQ70374.1 bifunctional proline dehydrogenase/L-glutamate gamma-semialdehyde dehydrogenase [Methylosinus trichosporium OB3b]OBS53226.1 bifunctional proline dehydrogenase/L-glutamate gamma-semialdehyde dehydrogenase [Methylosinus sp. 3S-1]
MTGAEPFRAPYHPADEDIAARLLAEPRDERLEARANALGRRLLAALRSPRVQSGVESLLQEYSLSTREGLALMALAESLLRVPDDSTLDRLIVDKLAAGAFDRHAPASDALLAQACAFALGVSTRLFAPSETPRSVVADLARRLGMPALRVAARQAMKVMGGHFVLGETIEDALTQAASAEARRWRYSFDMLGEGARTMRDAERYFDSYALAITTIGARGRGASLVERPGVSVKLSALHPRYEPISRERILAELAPRLLELARLAKARDISLTVDAEEADRLELSLDVIGAVLSDPSLAGWDGFGLAVQAYQKRALAVIGHVEALAEGLDRRVMLRLVKGAYWDTEIKRAQERGLDDYPVFTRKAMTDLSYIACADRLFAAPRLFPQFATHNALTVATIVERAGASQQYEFQRLHGMGEALYDALREERPDIPCRLYAPVGPHRDLLAYLVRRLIENGANSSFVARAADAATPEGELLQPPADLIGDPSHARHSHLPLPRDLFAPRKNSRGVEFGDREALASLLEETREHAPRCDDAIAIATRESARVAMAAAAGAFPAWERTDVETRAAIIERAADLVETKRGELIALLQDEAGKTLDDALAEVREAADLCRYYASEARLLFRERPLPGPTGEDNRLIRRGRGVFVCISPWNFPLAIFTGQVAAALVCGNSVAAKPAAQTPLVARAAITLLHEAGVPRNALQFVPGGADIGAALVVDAQTAGVVFTGSSETARAIHRALAASDGPIVPFVAETGGVNAMIVDSTALLEQVIDDVLASAFRSAGQRCSALRLLCLQEEIYDDALAMLIGAARELRVGDPRDLSTHVGPVIDAEAKAALDAYLSRRRAEGSVLFAAQAPQSGSFVAPHIVALTRAGELREEIFGPVLHVARWRAGENGFARLVEEIAASGFGLTMGLHSRIETRISELAELTPSGNLYVNRNMIGAVVGSQPFGGWRASGTGPKAGGPDYLRRFLREVTLTVNTASFGGDARLLSMKE